MTGSRRSVSSTCRVRLLAALTFLGIGAAHAQDAPVSKRAGLLSALVVRGLQFSDTGSPVALVGVDVYSNAGWSAGASAMALRSTARRDAGGWILRARRDWLLAEKWTLAIGARHDGYVGDTALQSWCYNQMDASATYGDFWNATGSWRPNGGPGCPAGALPKPKFAVDFNARWPVAEGVAVDTGAGRLFRGGAGSYDYGQWGVAADGPSWTLHLGRTLTHGAAAAVYGDLARARWVASAIWRF